MSPLGSNVVTSKIQTFVGHSGIWECDYHLRNSRNLLRSGVHSGWYRRTLAWIPWPWRTGRVRCREGTCYRSGYRARGLEGQALPHRQWFPHRVGRARFCDGCRQEAGGHLLLQDGCGQASVAPRGPAHWSCKTHEGNGVRDPDPGDRWQTGLFHIRDRRRGGRPCPARLPVHPTDGSPMGIRPPRQQIHSVTRVATYRKGSHSGHNVDSSFIEESI